MARYTAIDVSKILFQIFPNFERSAPSLFTFHFSLFISPLPSLISTLRSARRDACPSKNSLPHRGITGGLFVIRHSSLVIPYHPLHLTPQEVLQAHAACAYDE